MIDLRRPLKLVCSVQHYAWGKVGSESIVARVLGESSRKPYAEMWMGAHPSAPSKVAESSEPLDALIAADPVNILGARVAERFHNKLPFLFKLLSVGTALSIQAHPNRALAAKLNREDPAHYPDDNHKPELAIALSNAELLYGFRDLRKIKSDFERLPELAGLLKDPKLSVRLLKNPAYFTDSELLRDVYTAMLIAPPELVERVTTALAHRLESEKDHHAEDLWFLRLRKDYPKGDVGLFSFYALNLFELEAGSGIFVGAGVPHAYLSGDLVECMANSDNVLRAGLTPKFKDVTTLLEMLMFNPASFEPIAPNEDASGVRRYGAPAEEFYIDCCTAREKKSFVTKAGPQIVFCLEGRGKIKFGSAESLFEAGDCYFLPALLGESAIELESGRVFRAGVP